MYGQNAEAIRQNLADAGCDAETIEQFLACLQQDDRQGEGAILARQRSSLLGDIHQTQHCMEAIGALLTRLKGNG